MRETKDHAIARQVRRRIATTQKLTRQSNNMTKSPEIKNLATALAKFQGEVKTAKKESDNPFFKSKYADLATIIETVREPLANNGLSFAQFPTGENQLTTILMHTSGEWMEDVVSMSPMKEYRKKEKIIDGKVVMMKDKWGKDIPVMEADTSLEMFITPQAQGSAITYMRRYALGAILGIATEIDDDGNKASGVTEQIKAEARKAAGKKVEKKNVDDELGF